MHLQFTRLLSLCTYLCEAGNLTLSRKQVSPLVLRKIGQNPEAKEKCMDFETLKAQRSFKIMTREEKIREASKPLYLRRYE